MRLSGSTALSGVMAIATIATIAAAPSCARSGSLAPDLAASEVPAGPFPKQFRDPLGNERRVDRAPVRIASAMLAADEMLLELVEPERLCGLTYLIDEPATTASARLAPAHAARIPHGEVEPIVALEPDLVIVAGYTPADVVLPLLWMGAPVVRIERYRSFEDIAANVAALGRATGSEPRARELVASMRARIDRVKALPDLTPPPRVLYWGHGYTSGSGTLVDQCIRLAGAINVASELGLRGEAAIGAEVALATDPDVVVVPIAEPRPRARAPELLVPAEHWRACSAFRRRAVHGLPMAWTGSVSQNVLFAAEAIARSIRGQEP